MQYPLPNIEMKQWFEPLKFSTDKVLPLNHVADWNRGLMSICLMSIAVRCLHLDV